MISINLDCAYPVRADLGWLNMIARLHLRARAAGRRLRLINVNQALLDLIELGGLAEVLSVEPRRQVE